MFIGGKGGSGKTSSLLRSLNNKNIIYSTFCWNLIQGQKAKHNDIMGFSLPNLTGSNGKIKTEKVNINRGKYLIIDEATLINTDTIEKILLDEEYNDYFIFILGDIDEDGKFYQCSIDKNIINPSNYDIQYTKYTKSYRFNDELNNKLDYLRKFMFEVYDDEFKNFKVVNLKEYHERIIRRKL